jgi:hypothetical protein
MESLQVSPGDRPASLAGSVLDVIGCRPAGFRASKITGTGEILMAAFTSGSCAPARSASPSWAPVERLDRQAAVLLPEGDSPGPGHRDRQFPAGTPLGLPGHLVPLPTTCLPVVRQPTPGGPHGCRNHHHTVPGILPRASWNPVLAIPFSSSAAGPGGVAGPASAGVASGTQSGEMAKLGKPAAPGREQSLRPAVLPGWRPSARRRRRFTSPVKSPAGWQPCWIGQAEVVRDGSSIPDGRHPRHSARQCPSPAPLSGLSISRSGSSFFCPGPSRLGVTGIFPWPVSCPLDPAL